MDRPRFVYVTYIKTTPEKLWQALTDGDFTSRYWYGRRVASDWKVGSPYRHTLDGAPDLDGKILEVDKPRRLSFTFTAPSRPEFANEQPSRVVMEIEPQGPVVRFVVTHDDFEPGSKIFESIGTGWPAVLSSLKSLLETGEALPADLERRRLECAGGKFSEAPDSERSRSSLIAERSVT